MAQADLNVANQSGSAFRADLNNQLLALGTLMSGASEPSTTYAYMLWADTANAVLKQRNAANGAWITLRNLDGTYARGTAGSPSISFDGGTGIYSLGDDQVAISTAGTGRLFIDASGRILAGVSTALTNAYSISTALAPVVQIEGNTGNAAALSITRHASAAANLLLQRGVTGTPVADTEALGQVNFNGFDGTNYINAALIRAVVEGTPGTGSMPGRLSFQTTASGASTATERLRIDSAGQIMAAALGTASLPIWSFTGDPNTGIYSPSADALAISTGGTARVTVNSSGSVGIGTTSPGSPLTVESNAGNQVKVTYPSVASYYLNVTSGGALAINKDGTEYSRWDSSGRLLVGTSSARGNFFNSTVSALHQIEGSTDTTSRVSSQVYGAASSGGPIYVFAKHRSNSIGGTTVVQSGDEIGEISFQGSDGTEFVAAAAISSQVDGTAGANDMPGRLVFSTTADGASSPTERMRITSGGSTCLGKTSGSFPTNGVSIGTDALEDGGMWNMGVTTTAPNTDAGNIAVNQKTSGAWLLKAHYSGMAVGGVRLNGTTGTSFATTSDYRLKENVVPLDGAIARLTQLSVHRFNFIAEPEKTVDGFIAHEVEPVVPEAVCGGKDAVDGQGEIIPQGIDQSKLVPLLTAALQEAITKIENLEARLTAAGIE